MLQLGENTWKKVNFRKRHDAFLHFHPFELASSGIAWKHIFLCFSSIYLEYIILKQKYLPSLDALIQKVLFLQRKNMSLKKKIKKIKKQAIYLSLYYVVSEFTKGSAPDKWRKNLTMGKKRKKKAIMHRSIGISIFLTFTVSLFLKLYNHTTISHLESILGNLSCNFGNKQTNKKNHLFCWLHLLK